MTDQQIAELVAYLRRQFAPEKPPWPGVEAAVIEVRGAASR
jgi:nicotinate dehydrogenase subunit B